jgi:2-polyprenyl-3-methyl-5-hydroxy-6-metoxy-1,4-benzoquinol methylase
MYQPLHELPLAQRLVSRSWPPALDDVVTQQVREVMQERELRASIPRLTPIEDKVSQLVRQQYEESPYPRWVDVSTGVETVPLDRHLRELFPTAAFSPLGKSEDVELLIAGCGTGRHAIWIAQRFQGARILAVDLSLSSICFAKRKTAGEFAGRITYAQADILKLAAVGRTFDVIDASGVLHHMADPLEGWRTLLGLLRPGGFMHVCLYSELGRQDVVAVRAKIAEQGLGASPAEIRRCRQDLLETPLRSITRFDDYFSMSECRDLLFHVQESRTTIPEIKTFVTENKLKFIGFVFDRNGLAKYRALFTENRWPIADLDRWHEIETKYPDTFSAMYQFWVQKT